MSLRTGNATRDRILNARDEFRNSLPPEQHDTQVQTQTQVQSANDQQQQPVASQVQPANVQQQSVVTQVQSETQNSIPVPDDFVNVVNTLGTANEPVANQASSNADIVAMREENAKLLKEVEELRKARESDSAALDELAQYREKKRVDDYLASIDGGLGTINGDDARKLVSPLLQQIDQARKDNLKQIQDAQEAVNKRFAEYDRKSELTKSNQLYAKIMKAHPDLQQLQSTPAYAQVMMSPVQEGSAITVGEVVAAEIKKGNADYVIKVLDSVKAHNGTAPNLNAIASVSANATASGATSGHDVSGDKLTDEQIADYRFKVQTGEMSRDEFRQIMARHREASRLH